MRDLTEKLKDLIDPDRDKKLRHFSNAEAKRIGDKLGVDWSEIPLGEFRAGLTVELEHGKIDPHLDVTHDDLLKTGKIALAHLDEDPHYYTRIRRAGVKDVPPTK